MKFSEHLIKQPELLLCGKCPFLVFSISGSFDTTNYKGPDQSNECGISKYYFGEADKWNKAAWGTIGKGLNPKRTEGCLQLFKHFHSQLTIGVNPLIKY